MPESKTSERRRRALLRSRRAWELRLAGNDMTQIGKMLGVSHQQASKDVARALEEYRKQFAEEVADGVRYDLARLDKLILTYFPLAEKGDRKAAELVLNLLKQRERMLGYAAPAKQEVTLTAGDMNLDALKARLEDALKEPTC